MSVRFNVNEVLEMAAQMELNGIRFYTRAAENASDPATLRCWPT